MTNAMDHLTMWFQHQTDTRLMSVADVAGALRWSNQQTQEALNDMALHYPLFRTHNQLVNPWSTGNPEELAQLLYPDGYLSMEWALARWGCLSQQPTVLTVITATEKPHPPRAVTVRWSLECVPPIPDATPVLHEMSAGMPLATAAQALVDWAYYRWLESRLTVLWLESFLDDCDRDVVEDDLITMAQEHPLLRVRQLAQSLLHHWPSDSRWPTRI